MPEKFSHHTAGRVDERLPITGEGEGLDDRQVRETHVYGAEQRDLEARFRLLHILSPSFFFLLGDIRKPAPDIGAFRFQYEGRNRPAVLRAYHPGVEQHDGLHPLLAGSDG